MFLPSLLNVGTTRGDGLVVALTDWNMADQGFGRCAIGDSDGKAARHRVDGPSDNWRRGTYMSIKGWLSRGPGVSCVPAPAIPKSSAVPAEYRSLHKYLDERYANTVVLTFKEIEDLLGFTLPALARLRQDWWANADADSAPPAHSYSWTRASRSATANLLAQTVVFERATA
jgi:hypothetical protein